MSTDEKTKENVKEKNNDEFVFQNNDDFVFQNDEFDSNHEVPNQMGICQKILQIKNKALQPKKTW